MYYSKFPIIFLKFGIFTEKILSDTFVPTFQNTLVKLFSWVRNFRQCLHYRRIISRVSLFLVDNFKLLYCKNCKLNSNFKEFEVRLWKKDAFYSAGIRAQIFPFPVDCGNRRTWARILAQSKAFLHSHHGWKGISFMWKMTFEIFMKSLRFETPWVRKTVFTKMSVCLSVCRSCAA